MEREQDGQSVRKFLLQHLYLSSKMLKHLKYTPNGICVNGKQVTVRYLLHQGDLLTLQTEDTENADIAPAELPIDILYEDSEVVVPSKPADMPTHPSHGHHTDTVANALAFYYAKQGIPFVFRPVNRLDRNTSGLLLVAKNKISAARMAIHMQNGSIQKSYLAVLDGEINAPGGEIHACLHRTAQSIILREICSADAPDADEAHTVYRVLLHQNGHTLVQAFPLTGRTHQLRVHFASIGHPITGDDLYGIPSESISRHALHSYTLTFPHPTEEREISLCAPVPDDFSELLRSVFGEIPPDILLTKEDPNDANRSAD